MQAWIDEKVIGFDFETSGQKPEYALQAWRVAQEKSWVTSFVWAGRRNNSTKFCGGLNPTRDDMKEMLEYAIENDCYLMAHNAAFDIGWLISYNLEDLVMQCKFLDSMLIWKHATIIPEYDTPSAKRFSYGLKAGVAQLWPAEAGYEDGVDFHDASPEARKKLHAYNERDVDFCLRLGKHWYEQLTDRQRNAMLIEAEALPLMAMAYVKGLPVNVAAIDLLKNKLAQREKELTDELQNLGVDAAIVRSNKELAKLLFETWELPVIKRTPSGGPSTDKDVLHELSLIDERAALISEMRNTLNGQSGFLAQIEASVAYNDDGMTHPEPRIFAAYTGRVQYSGTIKALRPNKNKPGAFVEEKKPSGAALQQVPKAAEFRDLIVAPPGMTLVESDAASQEFRWMAIASNDPVMLELCQPGKDPHTFMGAQIVKRPYDELLRDVKAGDKAAKAARNLGKLGNLSLGYRTSAKKLCQKARTDWRLPMELPEAESIWQAYRSAYPGVIQFWERQRNICASQKFAETFAGRRVNMLTGWGGDKEWSMHSTTINFPVQGSGADQKFLAIKYVKPLLKKYGARLALDLHDGLYWFCPSDVADAFIVELKDTLDNLPYRQEWGVEPTAPLTWDVKSGASWGALKDYEFDVVSVGGGSEVNEETNPRDTLAPSTESINQVGRRPNLGTVSVVPETLMQTRENEQGGIMPAPTSKSLNVTNEEYARAVYGDWFEFGWLQAGGDLAGNWTGGFAPTVLPLMTEDAPNYLSVASLKADAKTRSDDTFARAHLWVVDDVGSKIDAGVVEDAFGLPQAIIETSAGNAQWHYWLSEPVESVWLWSLVRDAFKKHETLKGGADGNGAGAYFRLPNGRAFKKKDASKAGFETKLLRYEPGEISDRLSIDDIARTIECEITDADVARYKAECEAARRAINAASLDTSILGADPILALFKAVDWPIHDYRINRQGFIAIECPWGGEHTDGNTEAGYHVSSGGFKCFHAHCNSRTAKDLRDFLESIATPESKGIATGLMFRNEAGEQDLTGLEDLAEDMAREAADVGAQMDDFVWVKASEKFVQISTNLTMSKAGFNMIATDIADAGASGKNAAASIFMNEGGERVDLMTYAPGEDVITQAVSEGAALTAYNRWRPGRVTPYPVESVKDEDADIAPWLEHVAYIIENDAERAFFLDWAAYLVKHQGKKINFAILLRSAQGVGKDLMLKPLVELLGHHNCQSISAAALESNFNPFMEARLVIVEELPPFHKKDMYEKLKALVSTAQDMTRVNRKNMPEYFVRNIQAWVLMSNHKNALALSADDRRYFVVGCDAEKKDAHYYTKIARAFRNHIFLAKLYRWLSDRDLSRFNPSAAPPMTAAKAEMVKLARSNFEIWVEHVLSDDGIFAGRTLITPGEIYDELLNSPSAPKDMKQKYGPLHISHKLAELGWRSTQKVKLSGGSSIRVWGRLPFELLMQLPSHDLKARLDKEKAETSTKRTLGQFED